MTGLIEGFGSFGAAIFQVVIGYAGNNIFFIFMILCLSAALFLLPMAHADFVDLKWQRNRNRSKTSAKTTVVLDKSNKGEGDLARLSLDLEEPLRVKS